MTTASMSRFEALDVHFTKSFYRRFLSSLSEPITEIVICSPYFGNLPSPYSDVVSFCVAQLRRGVDRICVITGPLDTNGKSNAMPISVAKDLVRNDIEVYIFSRPFLHAKLYHFEYRRGYFRSFVGSSNFTLGGLRRNHELVAEMEGVGKNSPCHREIFRMLNSAGTFSYENWVAKQMPKGQEEEV